VRLNLVTSIFFLWQDDQLPSTPQLNAIMSRAMGKVNSQLKELEMDKGKVMWKLIYYRLIRGCCCSLKRVWGSNHRIAESTRAIGAFSHKFIRKI